MDLSPAQRAAVELDAHSICVVAGPGSGKTRILIERFAWLVEQRNVDPRRILAITFTEKAANEMKQRLARRFAYSSELREKIETAWLSTIDAFCARLLGEHAIEAGLPPDFSVLEPSHAIRLQRESAEESLDELFAERPAELRRLMEALDLSTQDDGRQPDLAQSLIDCYETMRLSGRLPGVYDFPAPIAAANLFAEARGLALAISSDPNLAGGGALALLEWVARFLQLPADVSREHFAVSGAMPSLQRFSRKGSAFQAALRLKKELLSQLEAQWAEAWYGGLPDLLKVALQRLDRRFEKKKQSFAAVDFTGLEEKAIQLLEGRSRLPFFEHILMDELQDTNRLQWRLVNLLRGDLFAVGDINQSIYGFRHADRTVFEEYRACASVVELAENYRSRPEILEAVDSLLAGQTGVEPRALQSRRAFAAVHEPVVERFTGRGDDAEEDEAAQVAARMAQWLESKRYRCRDMAILVRTLNATPPFEQALDKLHIPFLVSGGRTFLEARESKDLLAFLAALVNPLDEIALITVLRSPLMGWSDEQIFRASHEGWQHEFERLFGRIRRLADFIAPDRLIAQALDECGYLADLNERAQANVDKLLAWLRREHRARPRPLSELLEELEALREIKGEAEAPPPEATEAVRIMSIHAAKGLEFPVVFLGALHRGPDRRTPVILFSPDSGLGMKWRNPATGSGISDSTHRAVRARLKAADDAEENRLLYVAMTRAEDRLILSYSERKQQSAWVKLANRIEPSAKPNVEQPSACNGGFSPRPSTSPIILNKVPLSAQHDNSAAASSIALFEACPRKYYLGRYLSLDVEPTESGTGALELGLAVHRALSGADDRLLSSAISTEAQALAQQFHESPLGRRAARAQRAEREFDFEFALEDLIIRGQIDLWFEESGELIVVDYKTDRGESSLESYSLQLRLYALALELYADRIPDRAVLFYLRSGQAIDVGVDAAQLDSARSSVRAFLMAQDGLDFPMKAGKQCLRCSFYGGLCRPPLAL